MLPNNGIAYCFVSEHIGGARSMHIYKHARVLFYVSMRGQYVEGLSISNGWVKTDNTGTRYELVNICMLLTAQAQVN